MAVKEDTIFWLAARFAWPMIGLAMFAANISTVHLVSLAEAAYKYGLVFGNFEWMAGSTLILLSLFFAPLYLRAKVATLPDFLERRFNRACRDVLSVVSLFSAIVIHMGVALYTAAYVLRGILGLAPGATIFGVDALLLFHRRARPAHRRLHDARGVARGGLDGERPDRAAVGRRGGDYGRGLPENWRLVRAGAGVVVAPSSARRRGREQITWGTGNFLHIWRAPGDPSGLAWYSIILGYPVLGIWYWCCDQTMVQRVLAAKDETNARLGPLFCAFLKIFPVFLFVLPGVICVALVQEHAFAGSAPVTAADTYPFLLTHLLPIGLKGLVIAAMLAAAMQTCSAALNSTATLVAYDLFKRYQPGSQRSPAGVHRQSDHRRRNDCSPSSPRRCSGTTPRFSRASTRSSPTSLRRSARCFCWAFSGSGLPARLRSSPCSRAWRWAA